MTITAIIETLFELGVSPTDCKRIGRALGEIAAVDRTALETAAGAAATSEHDALRALLDVYDVVVPRCENCGASPTARVGAGWLCKACLDAT